MFKRNSVNKDVLYWGIVSKLSKMLTPKMSLL